MSNLAIVIPAYKKTFLSKTLQSLALQTNNALATADRRMASIATRLDIDTVFVEAEA